MPFNAQKYQQSKSYGYSLIELLIYILIFSIVSLSTIQLFTQTQKLKLNSENQAKLKQASQYILSNMAYSIHSADNITEPLPQTTSPNLKLNSGNISYSVNSDSILLKTINSQAYALHDSNLTISDIRFTNLGSTDLPIIKIEFSISHITSPLTNTSITENYQTTIFKR